MSVDVERAVGGERRDAHFYCKCIIFSELFFFFCFEFQVGVFTNKNFRHHSKCLNDSNVQEVDNFRIKPSKHTVITRFFLLHVLIRQQLCTLLFSNVSHLSKLANWCSYKHSLNFHFCTMFAVFSVRCIPLYTHTHIYFTLGLYPGMPLAA